MKHAIHVVGIAFVGAMFCLLVLAQKEAVLADGIIPPEEMDIEDWLESFHWWTTVAIGISVALSVAWYVLGQWVFQVLDWNGTDRRRAWVFLGFVAFVSSLVSIWMTERAQEGALWSYLFHLLNGLGSFYLATTLFSPSSVKYAPAGARSLRRFKLSFS